MAQSMNPSIPLDEYGSIQRSMPPRSMYGSRQDNQDFMDYDLMKREQKRALSAMADRASRDDQHYKGMSRAPMRESATGRYPGGGRSGGAMHREELMQQPPPLGSSRTSRSLMELEGQMMQLEKQIEMRRRNEEMLKRELEREQISRNRSMSAYPMMGSSSSSSRSSYQPPPPSFPMPVVPPLDFMRTMMPPPPLIPPPMPMHSQMRFSRDASPMMMRKTPVVHGGRSGMPQLEDEDVICVEDDDFSAEGFINSGIYGSGSSSREVMMGRRKLAPVQKASVRNRLGGAAAADLGGPGGLVTSKNRPSVEKAQLMDGVGPGGLAGRIGGTNVSNRLGLQSGGAGGGLGNRLGAPKSAINRLSVGAAGGANAKTRLALKSNVKPKGEMKMNILRIMPVPSETSEDEVKAVFEDSSNIVSVTFSKPRKNRTGPGEVCVALVEFDSVENCEGAFEGLATDLQIGDMACKAQLGAEKVGAAEEGNAEVEEPSQKKCLCIMPIPASTSEEEIKEVLVNPMNVTSVSFTQPRRNKYGPGEVCCAIVEFDSGNSCAEAFEAAAAAGELEVGAMKCKAQLSDGQRKRRNEGGGFFPAKRQYMGFKGGFM